MQWTVRMGGLLLAALTAGCAGGVAGPDANEAVVDGFQTLARQAATDGDQDLADALGSAAGAMSHGVAPASLAITLDGAQVRFDALVVGRTWRTPDGLVTFRSLVAWTGGDRLDQVLYVGLAADQAPIGQPGPAPGPLVAGAVLLDAGSGRRWVGADGNGAVKLEGFGSECPWPTALAFPCRRAAFLAGLQATLAPAPGSAGSRTVSLAPAAVAGFVYGPSQ